MKHDAPPSNNSGFSRGGHGGGRGGAGGGGFHSRQPSATTQSWMNMSAAGSQKV